MIDRSLITGLVLAGGRGSRMGGLDKGLQTFRGTPLALNALNRLAPQVGSVMLSANRHLQRYESFGVPVWPDSAVPTGAGDYAGPLAGFLAGLAHCPTPYLLTVPCDVPLFPDDLAVRLTEAMTRDDAEIVIAALVEEDAPLRKQPVFCLMRASLLESLKHFVRDGGRKPGAWTALLKTRLAAFDQPGHVLAFANANTLDELHQLEAGRSQAGIADQAGSRDPS